MGEHRPRIDADDRWFWQSTHDDDSSTPCPWLAAAFSPSRPRTESALPTGGTSYAAQRISGTFQFSDEVQCVRGAYLGTRALCVSNTGSSASDRNPAIGVLILNQRTVDVDFGRWSSAHEFGERSRTPLQEGRDRKKEKCGRIEITWPKLRSKDPWEVARFFIAKDRCGPSTSSKLRFSW